MEINIGGRRTGKTTECIKRMKEDPEIYAIVHTEKNKSLYPKELHKRIFSSMSQLRGINAKKIIIDEIDAMDRREFLDIFPFIKDRIIFVVTTPSYSYNRLNTPLRELIKYNGGYYKLLLPSSCISVEILNVWKNMMSHDKFMAEVYGLMPTDEELQKRKNQKHLIGIIKNYINMLETDIDEVYED